MVVSILSRIYIVCDSALVDPLEEGGSRDAPQSNFSNFTQFWGEKAKIIGCAPFGFDAPCLGNPVSTTDMGVLKMINVEQTFIYKIGKYLKISTKG